jgi:hypothetical protein
MDNGGEIVECWKKCAMPTSAPTTEARDNVKKTRKLRLVLDFIGKREINLQTVPFGKFY